MSISSALLERPFSTGSEPARQPIYALEAEQAVVGALLLDNGVMDQIADVLGAHDFYVGAHRTIFEAIQTLLTRGAPADLVHVKDFLEKNDELQAIGGAEYIVHLLDVVPTTANVKAYGMLVHDKAILRDLARQATVIVDQTYDRTNTVDAILEDAERRIFEITERKSQRRSEYTPVAPVLTEVFARLERMMEDPQSLIGVPSGFMDLDRMLSGMQRSDLLILAARPSMGKTALALNFAANAALDHKTPVGFFSLEMSKEQVVMRLLSATARIDFQKLRTGQINNHEYVSLSKAIQRLSEIPLYIDETPSLSITALRAKARRLKRERNIQFIVVDYLQLMQSGGNNENRTQEITQISQGLKAIAKELDVPVLALSQLTRGPDNRTDKRPMLSDLRESGSIEQDADVVMFVFREEYYKPEDRDLHGKAEIIIAKQRNGPTGTVPLTFLHAFTRFENFTKDSY